MCYPNLQATSSHKLAPRSTACVFLGYPPDHKGYRCFDLTTRRIIISRHVVFDESTFPFARETHPPTTSSFDFLLGRDLDIAPLFTNHAAGGSPTAAPSSIDVEQPCSAPGGSGVQPPLGPSASSSPGRCGFVPPSSPSASSSTGGTDSSPLPAPATAADPPAPPGAPGAASGAPAGASSGMPGAPGAAVPAPGAPPGGAVPSGRFGQVYTRRPAAAPTTTSVPGRFGQVYSRRPAAATVPSSQPGRPLRELPLPQLQGHYLGPLPARSSEAPPRELPPLEPPRRPMSGSPPPPVLRRITRLQSGTIQPVSYKNLSADHVVASPVPANYRSALADPNWRAAMADEFQALVDNGTWRLVPRPPGANVVTGKWIFKHKFHSDGSLARHKARWVVRGFSQ